jgi:hypothetical protein
MNKLKSCVTAVFFISICLSVAGPARAEDGEKRVKMKDLPEIVQKTVRDQSKGAVVRGLAKEVENGKTFYEAELKVKGHNKDILIDETGTVVEIEEKTALSTLPAAVKAQILNSAGKGKIKHVEAITKNGAPTVYEALVIKAGKKSEIQVASDGTLISNAALKEESEENEKDEARERKTEKEAEHK